MNFRIKIANKKEAIEALTLVQKFTGKKIHRDNLTPEQWVDGFYLSGYKYISVHNDMIVGYVTAVDLEVLHYFTHLSEIISRLVGYKEYVVENVGKYTAKISRDGIEVGCQKISFEKFDEVAAMVAKFRSEK